MSASYAADLELARQCTAGDEKAWERFVLEYRPILYRAADALDPSGGARDLADSLYAELYGIGKTDPASHQTPQRKSLLHYYQGRSSLATWLRAVLSQRYVDRIRATRRLEPLLDEERAADRAAAGHYESPRDSMTDPDRARHLRLLQNALSHAVTALDAKDRLRLGCYYAQSLTLAETGRVLREHEATVSRQLARTRQFIRRQVEQWLRDEGGLNDSAIAECFASASEDAGPIDLDRMFTAATVRRKETAPDRS